MRAMLSLVLLALSVSVGAQPKPLCADRARLFANPSAPLPLPRADFIASALHSLRTTVRAEDTCGEELLTYLLEKTPRDGREVLASELRLVVPEQRKLLVDYGFLLIEGTRRLGAGGVEAKAMLAYFEAMQNAIDLKSMDLGLKVMGLHRPLGRESNGTTSSYGHGQLRARRVSRVFVGMGGEGRDSVDNQLLLTADLGLMVMIHETAHGLFESAAITEGPFAMSRGSVGYGGQPARFTDACPRPDMRDPKVAADDVFAFYEGLLDGGFLAPGEHRQVELNFRPENGDTTGLRTRLPTRLPLQKARLYGMYSYAEDWATAWEAYFYNSEEMRRTGEERAAAGMGNGLRRRYEFLQDAFAFEEGGQRFSWDFDATGGSVVATRRAL